MDHAGALRELSIRAFGPSNMTLKTELNASLLTVATCLSDAFAEPCSIEELVGVFPFMERMIQQPVSRPPPPPILNEACREQAISNYLRNCRYFRKKHPTYDRATKRNQKNPTAPSTLIKFRLGIDTKGCTHYGAGRIIASSVPDAAYYIDWMQGSEAFLNESVTDLIVSDLAIPDEDGLGCGTYQALVSKIIEWYHAGKYVIAKLNIFDYWKLEKMGIPVFLLYKPRRHNLEVIISVNIPSVGLEEEGMLSGIVEENEKRNAAIFNQHLEKEPFESVHAECFADDKDYASMIQGIDFSRLVPYAVEKTNTEEVTPELLGRHLDVGLSTWHDVVDARALLTLHNLVEDYVDGTPFEPPPAKALDYAAWDDQYKRKREPPMKLSAFDKDLAILTIPLAYIAAGMHHYSVNKISELYQVYVLNALHKVEFFKMGRLKTLHEMKEALAQIPRN